MNPNSSNICIRYSVWVIEEKYTHNLPIYLLYIIYNKIGANWCINPKRVKSFFKFLVHLWNLVFYLTFDHRWSTSEAILILVKVVISAKSRHFAVLNNEQKTQYEPYPPPQPNP